ncbi:hypothetical protein SESBI_30578 [Sesbania bispinosa]|nr:hypothetical protein SESBI_30578 [Sesbania bispinosa]
MKEEEVRHHLGVQGRKVFGSKSDEEMTTYLNSLLKWCLGGAMMAQYFAGVVKLLTEERDKLNADLVLEQETLNMERQKASDDAKKVADELAALQTEVKDLKSKDEEN